VNINLCKSFQKIVKITPHIGMQSSEGSPDMMDQKYNSVRLSPAASSKYILKNQKKIKSKQELHIPYRK